jgi:hypothetical protein
MDKVEKLSELQVSFVLLPEPMRCTCDVELVYPISVSPFPPPYVLTVRVDWSFIFLCFCPQFKCEADILFVTFRMVVQELGVLACWGGVRGMQRIVMPQEITFLCQIQLKYFNILPYLITSSVSTSQNWGHAVA